MKTKLLASLPLVASLIVSAPLAHAATLSQTMSGRILLQVESHGEAWYVYPINNKRYYLGRPTDAFNLMRSLGLGVSNSNILKMKRMELHPIGPDSDGDGLSDVFETAVGTDPGLKDTDGDGFDDKTEVMSGYNPIGNSKTPIYNASFASTMRGKILLQVDSHGEAWYVSPTNNVAYFLGRPENAYDVMRELGLGITNVNLESITSNDGSSVQSSTSAESSASTNSGASSAGTSESMSGGTSGSVSGGTSGSASGGVSGGASGGTSGNLYGY